MAKQFLANRSGQTPTLDEVPNETIKIYPTEAALDADLANLEENEIVATDEDNNPASGNQYPVDIVQDGNMHSVTSNAVAESLGYSTTEQLTGGKWIDGKPIYRKVLNKTFAAGLNQITHNLGIENYIKVDVFIRVSTSMRQNTKGYYNEQNRIVPASLDTNTMNVTTDGWYGNGYIILEYTKTAD